MPEIIHSTKTTNQGPWLIGRERLLELDQIFEGEWQKLLKAREDYINAKMISAKPTNAKNESVLREEISSAYGNKAERYLLIYLKGGRRMQVAGFDEAFREPALFNESPIGFLLNMEVRNVTLELWVRDEEDFFNGDTLTLRVAPDTNKDAKGLFAAMRTWVDTCKPPIWQTIWTKCRFLICIMTPCIFILSFNSIARSSSTYFGKRSLILCGVCFFSLALMFVPNVIIGIGRGEVAIKRWKRWMTFLFIGAPAWIIGNFIVPPIIEWFKM